ncbi:hypothetical protein [Loigolactobacillus iwatensis]|uniref:hypothetical protein n=1 Tax=Loigolactobacillus iwatensis TaxID=1267156 RepID=UPI000F7F06A2|nr:hypothetical protein [Loigolactobacillus iwatensis]
MNETITWRIMFYTAKFTRKQVETFVADLKKETNFGGYSIDQVTFDRATSDLLYITFQFEAQQKLDDPLIHKMVKYLYARAVHPGHLDTKQYYQIVNQSSQKLGIDYFTSGDRQMDITFWGTE